MIDDDRFLVDAVSDSCRLFGQSVATFGSAEEFLNQFDTESSGCIVLDLQLPGINGLELLSVLRRLSVRLPVILVSGHADVPSTVRAMRSGAFTVLQKPFSFRMLQQTIQEALSEDRIRISQAERVSEFQLRFDSLQSNERQLVLLLVDGKSNKQIAATLGLSIRGTEDCRRRAMQRMAVRTVAELVTAFRQAELFSKQMVAVPS